MSVMRSKHISNEMASIVSRRTSSRWRSDANGGVQISRRSLKQLYGGNGAIDSVAEI